MMDRLVQTRKRNRTAEAGALIFKHVGLRVPILCQTRQEQQDGHTWVGIMAALDQKFCVLDTPDPGGCTGGAAWRRVGLPRAAKRGGDREEALPSKLLQLARPGALLSWSQRRARDRPDGGRSRELVGRPLGEGAGCKLQAVGGGPLLWVGGLPPPHPTFQGHPMFPKRERRLAHAHARRPLTSREPSRLAAEHTTTTLEHPCVCRHDGH